MKSLLSNLLCASLLFFAVGCGKDKGGSGGSSGSNLTFDPNFLNPNSQQIVQNLNSWYNGTYEGNSFLGSARIKKVQLVHNSNQTCKELDLKLFKIPYCYSNSTSNSGSGTVLSETTATLSQDGLRISSRTNPELQALFNGSAGQIVQATDISGNGSIIRLEVLQNNAITSYIIDKNYHSLLNPVQKMTNSQTIVTQAVLN